MHVQDPIEVGCGSTQLGSRPWLGLKGYFDDGLGEEQFNAQAKEVQAVHSIEIRDREHLAYFKVVDRLGMRGTR